MIIQSWTDVVYASLQELWLGFAHFVPNLLGALVVLILGLIVAAGLGVLVQKVLEALRLDGLLKKLGLEPIFERAGLKLRVSYFFGRLVHWFVVLAFLLAVSDSLGLYALSGFLSDILHYLPNVIAAILIFGAAISLATFLKRIVTASAMGAKLHGARFLGSLTWWALMIFGVLAGLEQLNVATAIIQSLVTGLIAMFALAGGLAFGLGGKDYANHLVNRLRDHTEGYH